MFAKLFAINIVNNNYTFKRVPKVLKPKVKELIAAMVNDEELLAKFTQEQLGVRYGKSNRAGFDKMAY